MGIFNFLFKKWTNQEKLAYLKLQLDLIAVDGLKDDSEYDVLLNNMQIIKWVPEDPIDFKTFLSDAEKLNFYNAASTIRNMNKDKKRIVSIALKSMALADNKLMESEKELLKKIESATGIPKVLFSNEELIKYQDNDSKSFIKDNTASEKHQRKSSELHSNYQSVNESLLSIEESGIAESYRFIKTVVEKDEDDQEDFIIGHLRKLNGDQIISKMANFQTIEMVLGDSINGYKESGETSFNGYSLLVEYCFIAQFSYSLCQTAMFETVLSGRWKG